MPAEAQDTQLIILDIDGMILYPTKLTTGMRLPTMDGEVNRSDPEPYSLMVYFDYEGPTAQCMQWLNKPLIKKVKITLLSPTNTEDTLLEYIAENVNFSGWDITTENEGRMMGFELGRPKDGKINGKIGWGTITPPRRKSI